MSAKHTSRKTARSFQPHFVILGILCVAASFSLGIRTAGDVQPIAPSEAEETTLTGDMNSDQMVNIHDVIAILEVAQGYEEATPEQLAADPNDDGVLDVEDALRILHDIASL